MIRNIVVVALAFFALFVQSAQVTAQLPTRSGQNEEAYESRKVASLTTTDLLSAQDFAPSVSVATTKNNKAVGSLKSGMGRAVTQRAIEGERTNSGLAENRQQTSSVIVDTALMSPAGTVIQQDSSAGSELPNVNAVKITGSSGNQNLDELINIAATRNRIDPRLILAVMRQESSFNPRATSYKGARGLMQLMPATAQRFGVRDIYDPAQNIEGGARYLRFLLDTFKGDVALTLAGYNAGEHAVFRYGKQIPPYRETQDYVRKISAHYSRLTAGKIAPVVSNPAIITRQEIFAEIIAIGSTMTQY